MPAVARSSAVAVDDAALRAASSPRRRRILRLVWDRELSSRDIAGHLDDVTWQAVSLNLRVLREAGLVTERRDGARRLYRADRARCAALESLLRTMWKRDLEQLGAVLEEDRRKRGR
jgi:DNA-binding transcriptional ArsR family regulator